VRRLFEIAVGLGIAWAAARATQPSPALPAAPASADPLAATPPPLSPGAIPAPVGPAYDTDAAMTGHPEAVAGYTLRASLDPAKHTLHGEGRITWKNASRAPVNELWVHLYMNGFKNDKTLFARVPVDGFRGTDTVTGFGHITVKRFAVREMEDQDLWPGADKTSPGDPDDETDIRVPLPRPVEPGATITADVAWDEQLPPLTFRTGYVDGFHFVGQWFPKIARLEPDGHFTHFAFHHLSEFYADFGAYDVTIDTPDSMIVGATGRLEGEVRTSGRIERRYVQEDVHDFAFTAWDAFRELTGKSDDGKVSLRCLYPAGHERAAEIEMDTARFGLGYFGKAFGRYPYETLTMVHPPEGAEEAGGMEYPTLITTGGAWYEPYIGARLIDIVTIHELGHEWFYGLVATDEHAFPFLDEGLNSYAEADSMEARFPRSSALKWGNLDVSLWAIGRLGSVERFPNAPVAQPAPSFATGGDYASLVYSRTASILGTLAGVYGEDLVRRAIGRYTRRYRFEHPGPAELIGVIDEVVGHDAAQNLRAALFDRASVDYAVSTFESQLSEAPHGIFGDPAHPSAAPAAPPGAWTGDVLLRRRGALRFPVDVELHEENGTIQRVRWEAREPAERIPYTGKSRLVAVVIDPEHRVLLDENLANNAKRSGQALGGALLERAVYAGEAGLWGLQP
jgi:hypothetical protein